MQSQNSTDFNGGGHSSSLNNMDLNAPRRRGRGRPTNAEREARRRYEEMTN